MKATSKTIDNLRNRKPPEAGSSNVDTKDQIDEVMQQLREAGFEVGDEDDDGVQTAIGNTRALHPDRLEERKKRRLVK